MFKEIVIISGWSRALYYKDEIDTARQRLLRTSVKAARKVSVDSAHVYNTVHMCIIAVFIRSTYSIVNILKRADRNSLLIHPLSAPTLLVKHDVESDERCTARRIHDMRT